jgi:hypothetical protein
MVHWTGTTILPDAESGFKTTAIAEASPNALALNNEIGRDELECQHSLIMLIGLAPEHIF